ncbi:MAG TPA: ABC transporter substrate-binding protein, partial [Thermoanaerobacterales bacterium]|nr:ABC transporter substrate-binding protein [Thermoanaerobacterales bacterium]
MKKLIISSLVMMIVLAGCGETVKEEVINIGINQLVE